MIAYLQGTLQEIASDYAVLVAGGVGYQVFLAKNSLQSLPPAGTALELKIHTVVREDNISLYGFRRASEKDLFLKLIQVSSVGPKLALTIMSGLPAEELAAAIRGEDLVRLTAISGIGKKTAERLIVELKDKILGWNAMSSGAEEEKGTHVFSPSEDAISALMNLGYSRPEAQRALKSIPQASELPLETLVREGLKALS
ncbi:MAG TPA: Holliday junction branch migration protein RuvA [Deltaproteobacteria bacterium]|nr:Holliday junction branch migration protein RuvA [Deltaproteobacteria bacterium]